MTDDGDAVSHDGAEEPDRSQGTTDDLAGTSHVQAPAASETTADMPPHTEGGQEVAAPAVGLLSRMWRWLTARWWRWFAAAVGAFAIAVVSVLGQSFGNGIVGGVHRLTQPATVGHAQHPIPALGVTAIISYSDGAAVALAKPVTKGVSYAQVLEGPTDTGDGGGISWSNFLARNEGAPVGELHADVVLTGQAKDSVRVTNVGIQRVAPVQPAFSGTYVPIPHQGGQAAYQFKVEMDQANPTLTRVGGGQVFPDFNIALAPGEQTTLAIDFLAARYSYKCALVISYLVGNRAHTIEVKEPNGQPFAVTAPAKSYRVHYASNYPNSGYHLVRQPTVEH